MEGFLRPPEPTLAMIAERSALTIRSPLQETGEGDPVIIDLEHFRRSLASLQERGGRTPR